MYTHSTYVRVRYSETDQMGYVYYGNYAAWFEVGRVESLRSLGLSYRAMEDQGVMLPVLTYDVKYIKPAKYDDEVRIETNIIELPKARISFSYKCFRVSEGEKEELLTLANTTLVFIDMESGRPTRCPVSLTQALMPHFESGLR